MNVNNDPSLSLLSALRPSSRASQAPRTQQSTPLDLLQKPNRTGLPPAATATAPEGLTVDGLLEAWGGKSETYDLNDDGGVNMLDLVDLLKSMSGKQHEPTQLRPADPEPDTGSDPPPTNLLPPVAAEPEPTQLAPTQSVTEPTQLAPTERPTEPTQLAPPGTGGGDGETAQNVAVRDLLAAWGTNDPEFDLNADGTVNMADLVTLLRDLNTPETPGGDLASGNPLTLRGLLENWGATESRYDLDRNGTVNMRDLVDMLGRLADAGRPTIAGTNLADESDRATRGGLRPIAASLTERLRAGGFDAHPPANIHKLVGSLNLTPGQEKELLSHLDAKYPAGLGVNLVG